MLADFLFNDFTVKVNVDFKAFFFCFLHLLMNVSCSHCRNYVNDSATGWFGNQFVFCFFQYVKRLKAPAENVMEIELRKGVNKGKCSVCSALSDLWSASSDRWSA